MKYLFLTFFHSQIHFSENPYSKNAKHCIYFVHDCSYAGTDANVYVNIVGSHGQTGKIMLIKSQTNKNPFEKGQTDIFSVHGLPVGKIVKIQVGHDNSGFASAWYVDNVSFVTSKYQNIEILTSHVVFHCNRKRILYVNLHFPFSST